MAERLPVLRQRFFDSNGAPLAGGKLYSYVANTATPVVTYQDKDSLVPNSNPIILDPDGYADVFIIAEFSYKFVLADADDNILWTQNEVIVGASGGGGGGSGVGYSPWITHNIVDGQGATDLAGETLDISINSSAKYLCEIVRGTTVVAGGPVEMQDLNGVGRALTGVFLTTGPHGVVFTVSQVGNIVTLKAAASTGPGNGTVKLCRILVPKAS